MHQRLQDKTGKWTIVRDVSSRSTREEYKTAFPHETFDTSYDARMFLHEHGFIKNKPTRRHHIDVERGIF